MSEQSKTQLDTSSSKSDQKRVLIVDDELMIRTLAEKILGRAGFGTVAVASGPAAIEATVLWGAEITVAIVDYSMAGMSGLDTIRELQKIAPHLTYVISSGYILGSDDLPGDFTGDVHFLQKPYRANQLTELVTSILSKR